MITAAMQAAALSSCFGAVRLERETRAFFPSQEEVNSIHISFWYRFAFLPFGIDPRVGIGAQLAMSEATLAIAGWSTSSALGRPAGAASRRDCDRSRSRADVQSAASSSLLRAC
jgi:cytochrome P450